MKQHFFEKNTCWTFLLAFRYFYVVFITFLAANTVHRASTILIGLVELAGILALSYGLLAWNRVLGHIVHGLLLLLYSAQTLMLYFSGTFFSIIMVTNFASVEALSGKLWVYLGLVIPMVIFAFVPAKGGLLKKGKLCYEVLASGVLTMVLLFAANCSDSRIFNGYELWTDWTTYRTTQTQLSKISADADIFYRSSLGDDVTKPDSLVNHPNVILIFMEGLSENIILDQRDIMPNLSALREASLRFDNYYNHSFATYRGLIGQLYSGYQYENSDTNQLVSIQSIFKSEGYATSFINTEPNNTTFTTYLESFGFDEVVSDLDSTIIPEEGLSDKTAYELLYQKASALNSRDEPFFLSMYSFGTHVSWDSANELYGDGSNSLLNRFYNADYQFGLFLEKFKNSDLFEDTILVFTTDHASYVDDDFLHTFPNYTREFSALDTVPFFIYHQGISASAVDANGRNSLCMAPTVLDYLDISAPNYFLGNSLFGPYPTRVQYETIHNYIFTTVCTYNNEFRSLTASEFTDFQTGILQYAAAKGTALAETATDYVASTVSNDCSTLSLSLVSENTYENVWFPVWSEENDQDDLVWYLAEQGEDGAWRSTVDLSNHNSIGTYMIHAYAGEDANSREQICLASVYIPEYPPFSLRWKLSEDGDAVKITLNNCDGYTNIQFPIWSMLNDQDDLVWYPGEKDGEGNWSCTVKLAAHCARTPDSLIIHAYGTPFNGDSPEFLNAISVPIAPTAS